MRSGPPIKILLVDDAPANLLALRALLDAPGYTLVEARSGFEAVGLAQDEDFAAIILDVQMPGMDGYETARRIKNSPRGGDIPIIFVTAIYKENDDVVRGYEAGGIDYFAKPLVPDILRAKVKIYADLYRKTRQLSELERLLAAKLRRRQAPSRLG